MHSCSISSLLLKHHQHHPYHPCHFLSIPMHPLHICHHHSSHPLLQHPWFSLFTPFISLSPFTTLILLPYPFPCYTHIAHCSNPSPSCVLSCYPLSPAQRSNTCRMNPTAWPHSRQPFLCPHKTLLFGSWVCEWLSQRRRNWEVNPPITLCHWTLYTQCELYVYLTVTHLMLLALVHLHSSLFHCITS